MDGTKYGGYHSYEKFGLLRSERPIISDPEVKTHIVDNPGGNGDIDLTTSLTGVPQYKNRTITESFIAVGNKRLREQLPSKLYAHFDGSREYIIMDSDPGYMWFGRSMVKGIDKTNETHMRLNIVSDVEPFKYERFSSTEDWEWDSLNFETGIIRDYRNLYVNGELDVEIIGTKAPVNPKFRLSGVTSDISVEFYDPALDIETVANLSKGEDSSDIIIREGINVLHFRGKGYVTIEYRGGIL